ncbi:MAG: hypothetical protein QF921_00555 [Pseudomonadales bacterium]|nr:hypothetical protein [Pseudomonadales bacterium]
MMTRTGCILTVVLFALACVAEPLAQEDSISRTESGRPDLTGTYDAATLTPLERPAQFGDIAFLTPEEAKAMADRERGLQEKGASRSASDREAPPEGGSKVVGLEETVTGGNEFGAGNVGAYNLFWMDRGTDVNIIDGKIPTSILVEPGNGRMPSMTPEAQRKFTSQLVSLSRPNDGTAWWVEMDGPGPYDGPESLPLRERCVLGFTGVAPTLPGLYNNFKRIVQTEDHVVILLEMVHDARIVRLKQDGRIVEHPGPEVQFWLGDSIGWWEDDTLVVDTTNLVPQVSLQGGGSAAKHVVERFTKLPSGDVLYRFTVEDELTWTAPWTGQYLWRASDESVYEYACHEGNYAMENVLRGARLLEAEALGQPLPEIR